jgi:hypothetical protein
MNEPIWQKMQLDQMSRKDRTIREAQRRLQQARLPPRMERYKQTEGIRKSLEIEKVRQEAEVNFTYQPKITEPKHKEDFDMLHHR